MQAARIALETATAAFQSDLAACHSLTRDRRQFDQGTVGATVLDTGADALPGAADDDAVAAGGAGLAYL